MANAVTGVLHGATITLDAPVPPLDGRRVRVVIEAEISAEENAGLLSGRTFLVFERAL